MDIVIDELIRSKRKTVLLTITKDARLVVKVPVNFPRREIERLIEEKKSWIIKNKSKALERMKNAQAVDLSPGGRFMFLGETYTVEANDNVETIMLKNGRLLIPVSLRENISTALMKWCRDQAKIILQKRLKELSEITGIHYTGSRITSAKSRWGSCSCKNTVNLSWRLVLADKKAIDYVIIHELCHVLYKNHSKLFWQEVAKLMPDYAVQRKWLRDNAFILDVFK